MLLPWQRIEAFHEGEGAGGGAGAGEGGGEGGAAPGGSGGSPNGLAAGGAGDTGAPGEGFDFGKFRETIKDPKLKAAAERHNSLEEVLASNVTLRTEIADRIRLPGPNATDQDMDKFRNAFGVPKEAKAYEVAPPEGTTFSEEDKAIIEVMKPIAHAHNVPQKAFAAAMQEFTKLGQQMQAQALDAFKKQEDADKAALKKEWGNDYEKNTALAQRVPQAFEEKVPGIKQFLDEAVLEGGSRLGNHPVMMKLLSAIGGRMDESDLMVQSSATEKQSAVDELRGIYAKTPPGTEGYKDPEVQRRVKELNDTIYGTKKIVGGGGRTV